MNSSINNINNIFSIVTGDIQISFPNYECTFTIRQFGSPITHYHFFYEIFFILDGSCDISTPTSTHSLKANYICIISPNTIHKTSNTTKNLSYITLGVVFSKVISEYKYYTNILSSINKITILQSPASCDYMQQIMQIRFFNSLYYKHKTETLLMMLFVELFHDIELHYHTFDGKSEHVQSIEFTDEEIIRKYNIENFIQGNFDKQTNIKDLAKSLNLSNRQTNRSVQKLTGYTFNQLLTRQRMLNAETFVKFSNMNFNDISVMVGYQSYKGFHDAFKKYHNISPSDMRDENRKLFS